jgi:hypothetical protein
MMPGGAHELRPAPAARILPAMRLRMLLGTVLATATCVSPLSAQRVDTLAIRAHTRFLADDLLLGRGTGTAGEHLAAAYIASQLERLGLEPFDSAGDFLLPIPLRTAIIGNGTEAVLTRNGSSASFVTGRDFVVNTGGGGAFHDFGGSVLLAGPPPVAAARLRAHGEFRGRVIAVSAPLGAAAPALLPALLAGGASGVVVLVADTAQYQLFVRSRGDRRFFVAAEVQDPVWQPDLPVLLAGPALTTALLAGAGLTRDHLQGDSSVAVLDLGRELRARIDARIQDVRAANVGGLLPGTDPARRAQLIVYTAHYDHLGVSVPDERGDSIYNGFSDNAAGTGMLLAIAEALRAAPPPASVAFVFFTGEERGLLGSSFLAARPPFPLKNVRALINLDAGAPPAPPVSWRIAGGNATPLGQLAARVAQDAGWKASLGDASPNSDYWPFLARGVPAVFIVPGSDWENVTAEQQKALSQRWDRYHQAGDAWHPEFPFAGLGRYADYALRLGLAAAR